jgi:ATP-dependent Lon protease
MRKETNPERTIYYMNKIKSAFPSAAVYKSTSSTTLMNFLEMPADCKSWLLHKFTNGSGKLDAFALSEYVKEMRLKPDEWNIRLLEARHSSKGSIKLLTKVIIEFDYAHDLICFSLPEYGFPKKKAEAQVDWSVVSENKKFLLTPEGAWGEITLTYDCGIINLEDFTPLCPYSFDLNDYRNARKNFSTKEWIDVLLAGLNFNPDHMDEEAKLTLLQRFLPFVEKRLNTIELAIKGSGKSYCYSQLSQHNWLVGGGSVSRATAFYNNTTKKAGYFSTSSQVIWDEVQTIKCNSPEEMGGALKSYLENGEIRIGSYCGTADAGLTLIGNIPCSQFSIDKSNMFKTLPKFLKESALIDRFAGIIEGWKIGRFTEDRKMEGWAISTNYLTEIFNMMRDEFYYRAIVDELIEVNGNCDTRNLEAIKKLATAYLKLLFPDVRSAEDVNIKDFRDYCLDPAIRLRWSVLCQLRFLDEEYEDVKMPSLRIKGEEKIGD